MEKKKLLLIIPKIDQGGLERVCVRTARILEPDFQIAIAVFDGSNPAYDLTGLSVYDLKAPALRGKIGKAFQVLKRAFLLKKLKRKLKTDIAYSFGPTANRANLVAGGPGQIWCGLRSWADLEKKRELKLVADKSDRLVICSQVLAQVVEETCGVTKTQVLNNPYNMAELYENAQEPDDTIPDWEGCRVIVTLGREDDVKCYWHMLKAFAVLHRQLPQARLAIVGFGEFTGYKKLAEELGIGPYVCFPGRKKNPFPWLLRADLFAGFSSYEGFPNAMVEAMALGCPVVMTNCMTGPAEILSADYRQVLLAKEPVEAEYGVLLPTMDPAPNLDAAVITGEEERAAGVLYALLTDEERRRRLGQAAKMRAAVFSEEAYREKFLQIAGME